jgi:hypothetical protein
LNYLKESAMKAEKPVYFVSARPEAYEFWGEIGREEARRIAGLIARRAAERFPSIEFCVDDAWHDHLPGMEFVAAHIDANWQKWVAEAASLPHAA